MKYKLRKHGFRFHEHATMFPIYSFAHDCRRTLVRAECGYPNRLKTPTVKEEIHHFSSQYSGSLSLHPNDLVENLMAQHDNKRLRRHLPNDLPTRLLVQISYLE
jgi:hypothetical protein